MKILALSWAPFGHRMDELARTLGAARVSVTFLYGPRYFAPLRYLALFFRTLVLLATAAPEVVYAQNPPVFCALSSLLYCRAAGKKLAIDHHSIWRVKTVGGIVGAAIGFLEKFAARSADLNTAPHGVWAGALRNMGASSVLVVQDFVDKNPFRADPSVRRKYADTPMVAIASHGGHPLERVETEVAAAASVSGLTLLVTVPESKLSHRLENLPQNVRYLGLLPMEDYLRLKASCDFAVNVTDEPYTLSHVLFEYVASSVPIISSRQQVVEDAFGDSLIYVGNSGREEVSKTLFKLCSHPEMLEGYRRRTAVLFESLRERREAQSSELRGLIRQSTSRIRTKL